LPPAKDWGTEPRKPAAKVRLRDVLKAKRTVIAYVYESGDYWDQRITVTGVRAGDPKIAYPRYIGGPRHHRGVADQIRSRPHCCPPKRRQGTRQQQAIVETARQARLTPQEAYMNY
jgi:hypothetical protein